MPEQQEQTIRAVFSGHVQGVGFRYTVKDLATDYPVTGYVKNLADGTVELVASGEKTAVDQFIDSVNTAMRRYVRAVHIAPHIISRPTGFRILT